MSVTPITTSATLAQLGSTLTSANRTHAAGGHHHHHGGGASFEQALISSDQASTSSTLGADATQSTGIDISA